MICVAVRDELGLISDEKYSGAATKTVKVCNKCLISKGRHSAVVILTSRSEKYRQYGRRIDIFDGCSSKVQLDWVDLNEAFL